MTKMSDVKENNFPFKELIPALVLSFVTCFML